MAIAAGFAAAEALLVAHDAEQVAHPGGTLLDHLCRVRDRLVAWDAPPAVQLAGLCHAAYGTDGFPVALLAPDQRLTLTGVIGAEAEWLVHLYGTCRRRDVYPHLVLRSSSSPTASRADAAVSRAHRCAPSWRSPPPTSST